MAKTTLEIPDLVLRRAKARAAEQGITLRQFVTEAVEERLKSQTESTDRPWMQMAGGSPQRVKLANPGKPPMVGDSRTARTIACASASAAATPSASILAASLPSDRAITTSPSDIVFTG